MFDDALTAFEHLLMMLEKSKPNDRSEVDRYCAIVITEIEKAKAVYLTYCQNTDRSEPEST